MSKGYLAFVLHAHLPYVLHRDQEGVLEERWLYEAITECYIPLIEVFRGWERDRLPVRLGLSLTPPLAAMLDDELVRNRYAAHLDGQIQLADKECARTQGHAQLHGLAEHYRARLHRIRDMFLGELGGDVVSEFARLSNVGLLDILASAATHGYLPLLSRSLSGVAAQVNVGVDEYERRFGKRPEGFWLPECGYYPGIDELLAAREVKYFVLETHGVLYASVRPCYAGYAPIVCPSGVAAFARDPETSRQVWSAREGYPGDPVYREFYRDIGWELPLDYLEPHLPQGPIRTHTGFKYYRVTGPTDDKQLYDPAQAAARTQVHADNFAFNRNLQVEYLASHMDRPPIIVSPYDAELFGHWWYEGPIWLDKTIRRLVVDGHLRLVAPGDYLREHRDNQPAVPCESSWGYRGYHEVWLGERNDWLWRHVHRCCDEMGKLAQRLHPQDELTMRALKQAAREALLASASDWPFILNSGTVVDYARARLTDHLSSFATLRDMLVDGWIDTGWLAERERHVSIFPDIDYRRFAGNP